MQGGRAASSLVLRRLGRSNHWRNAAVLLNFIGDKPASQNAWEKFGVYDPSAKYQHIPDNCVWEFYFR